jgi:hypothetical protein
MQLKTARLTILVTPSTKKALEEQCRGHDTTPSQVVRRLIREYMEEHPVRAATPAPLARRGR